jgi:hypothetical protein
MHSVYCPLKLLYLVLQVKRNETDAIQIYKIPLIFSLHVHEAFLYSLHLNLNIELRI